MARKECGFYATNVGPSQPVVVEGTNLHWKEVTSIEMRDNRVHDHIEPGVFNFKVVINSVTANLSTK